VDRAAYRAACGSTSAVVDKNDLIVDACRGKAVLDIGCIDHSAQTALELGDRWLHSQIREVSAGLVGLDLLADEAALLNERGFHIEVGDAQHFDLGRIFDVIVAGDVIEHVENPGCLLESARRHLAPNGSLIITTPNPFNVEQFGLGLRRNRVALNDQHVAWYDPRVLYELVTRCGFDVTHFQWIDTRFHLVRQPVLHWVNERVMRRRPVLRRDFAVVAQPAAPIFEGGGASSDARKVP